METADTHRTVLVSIVVLTYNRTDRVRQQYEYLSKITDRNIEIIIVDNCSEQSVENIFPTGHNFTIIRNSTNLGAVGRNAGMKISQGEIIVTLDDDVYGLNDGHLQKLRRLFKSQDIGAVNFSIREEGTGNIANWCHPYEEAKFVESFLETNQISEGAVALHKKALDQVGMYPEYFFISHEGPDLAFRMINHGWRVVYTPDVRVIHAYEEQGRPSWRRYYFDTRNQLWFVLRNCPFGYGLKKLVVGWGSMFVYALRDGYLRYWFKAIFDSFKGVGRAYSERESPKGETIKMFNFIEKNKPNFFVMLRKRLFSRKIKI